MKTSSASASGLLCIASAIFSFTLNVDLAFVQFETLADKMVKNELAYLEESQISILRCAAKCAEDRNCLSASYKEVDKTCLLSAFSVNGPDTQQRLITETFWTVLSKNKCWAGWVMIGDACYFIQEEKRNNENAKNDCEENGGKLAEPQTKNASDLLRNYMAVNLEGNGYWFGLNDIEVEDRFVWTSSGTIPSYTSWSPADPNEGRDANCVEYFVSSDYRWADRNCGVERGAVCEML